MPFKNPDALVTTDWLAANLDNPGIRIVDGSSFLPNVPRDAHEEFLAKHIPGAVLIDIEVVSDHSSDLPHMLPTAEAFGAKMGELGISNGHKVVVYDSQGVRTSPRIWWMFRVFGHDDVVVLDGGLPKWEAEGRSLASGETKPPAGARVVARRSSEEGGRTEPAAASFTATLRPQLVRSVDQMIGNQKQRTELVIDARPAGRFAGTADEPRPGIPSGHMPGAVNMPVELVIDNGSGCVLPPETVAANFEKIGVTVGAPAVTTCGSGVAACTTALGLFLLGQKDVPVYDGSWSEWGGRSDTEKTKS